MNTILVLVGIDPGVSRLGGEIVSHNIIMRGGLVDSQDLICLIERYLEPLKEETFLSCDDIDQLFGNIQEIVQFQKLFLHSLEDAVESVQNFNMYHQETNILKVKVLSNCFIIQSKVML